MAIKKEKKPSKKTSTKRKVSTKKKTVKIGDKELGNGKDTFVIAEIGINHNGDINLAKKLIDTAVEAGCDAVKFQKRTVEVCVPKEEWDKIRPGTPWGDIKYIDYKKNIEFGEKEYKEIDRYCKKKGILWTASCWDEEAVDFIDKFNPPFYKIASASLTDEKLLRHTKSKGRPIILSTGMSSVDEIKKAVKILGDKNLVILHCTSTYPSKDEHLNLRVIQNGIPGINVPIGYSGHETGVVQSVMAAILGACVVERHITLDRAMWGSDHAASLEPAGLKRLVRDIRLVPVCMGDGVKKIYDEEIPIRAKLRRI